MKWHSVLTGVRAIANYVRTVEVLMTLTIWVVAATVAYGQFRPIPNYVGIGAGAQFRADINNHLSGAASVAPRIVSLPLAQLPTEQDGQDTGAPTASKPTHARAVGSAHSLSVRRDNGHVLAELSCRVDSH